nr:hypothetical protein [Streptomyces chartreusis]
MVLAVTLGGIAAALVPGIAAAARPMAAISGTSSSSPISAPDSMAAVGPYTEAAFAATCTWHRFGEGEVPPWRLMFSDPLCVEYSKRDVTFDNGGALRFLIAEPSRFALTMVACRYFQKDHWSVQTTTGATPWVTWDGQYWWDKTSQQAGARLSNFRIDGTSVGVGDAVTALRSAFPKLADILDGYGNTAGETGLTTPLSVDLRCSLAR